MRQTDSEIVAFSDANATWSRRRAAQARARVRGSRGRIRVRPAEHPRRRRLATRKASTGATRWCMRAAESTLGSVTGGNGSIYALRREDYVEVDPRFGHDLSLPYLMVQRGRRAVYEPEANACERPTPTNETEYRRKVRMFEHCWLIVLRGKMLRRLGPLVRARDRLAPSPPLRLRHPARRAARDLARARHATGGSTTSCSRLSSCCSSRRSSESVSPATTCSSRRRRSSRSGTTCAVACRRPGSSPKGRDEPRARRRDRRGRARRHEPLARGRRARRQARGPRPGALPADPRRQGRRRLRAAEAADDDRRRGDAGRRLRGRQGRLAHHEGRAGAAPDSASTSCRSSGTSCAATWP